MKFEMQNVYDYIDQHADEYVEFLRTLVRQPSIADTGEGIQEMVQLVKQSLQGIGARAHGTPHNRFLPAQPQAPVPALCPA